MVTGIVTDLVIAAIAVTIVTIAFFYDHRSGD